MLLVGYQCPQAAALKVLLKSACDQAFIRPDVTLLVSYLRHECFDVATVRGRVATLCFFTFPVS